MFGALPSEQRVKEMYDRDFLWCGLMMMLDEEEERRKLCPCCQNASAEPRCVVCGALASSVEVNESFDLEKFYERGRGTC